MRFPQSTGCATPVARPQADLNCPKNPKRGASGIRKDKQRVRTTVQNQKPGRQVKSNRAGKSHDGVPITLHNAQRPPQFTLTQPSARANRRSILQINLSQPWSGPGPSHHLLNGKLSLLFADAISPRRSNRLGAVPVRTSIPVCGAHLCET